MVNFRSLLEMVLANSRELILPKNLYFLPYTVLNYTLKSYGHPEICPYGDKHPNIYFKVKTLFFSFKTQIVSPVLQGDIHYSAVPVISNGLLAINLRLLYKWKMQDTFLHAVLVYCTRSNKADVKCSVEQERELQKCNM